jgi:hypothetical protein
MKKLILLLLFIPLASFGQSNKYLLNGMKYVVYKTNIEERFVDGLLGITVENLGLQLIEYNNKNNWPKEAINNPCLISEWIVLIEGGLSQNAKTELTIKNCFNEIIFQGKKRTASGFGASFNKNLMTSSKRAFEELEDFKYFYNEKLTPFIDYPEVENISIEENSFKDYLENNLINTIEGVFKTYKAKTSYKLGIVKNGDTFKALILESELKQWKRGDVKAIFESTAVDGVYSVQYFLSDKTSIETFANVEGGLITIEFDDVNEVDANIRLLRLFPK